MNLLSFMILMSAIGFAFRIMRREFFDKQTALTKIGTFGFITIACLATILQNSIFNFFFAVVAVLFAALQTQIEAHLLYRRIDGWMISVLSDILLNLRSGISLRSSLNIACNHQTHPLQQKWIQQMIDNVTFLQQEEVVHLPSLLQPLLTILQKCEEQPHLQTSLLENYRSLLNKRSEFRQRSEQALMQMRIQSAIIVCLYFAVIALSKSIFGWNTVRPCFFLSLPFLLVGILVNRWIKRSFRWKT